MDLSKSQCNYGLIIMAAIYSLPTFQAFYILDFEYPHFYREGTGGSEKLACCILYVLVMSIIYCISPCSRLADCKLLADQNLQCLKQGSPAYSKCSNKNLFIQELLSVRILQRTRINRIYMISFKKLAHMAVVASRSKFPRTDWETGDTGRADAVILTQNSFFREPQLLLLRPSCDQVRHTHLIQGKILYVKSTDCTG